MEIFDIDKGDNICYQNIEKIDVSNFEIMREWTVYHLTNNIPVLYSLFYEVLLCIRIKGLSYDKYKLD